MITLAQPNADMIYYFSCEELIFGPVTITGACAYDQVSYRSRLDVKNQGEKYKGEHPIDNFQVKADIKYCPALKDAIQQNDENYPYFVLLKTDDGKFLRATHGIFVDGTARVVQYPYDGHPGTVAYGFRKIGDYWHTWYLGGIPYERLTWRHFCYKLEHISGATVIVWTQYDSCYVQDKYHDFFLDPSLGELESIPELYGIGVSSTSVMQQWNTLYAHTPVDEVSLATMESKVSAAAEVELRRGFPKDIPLYDFGNLALEASQSGVKNSVNMIAFLRDFRHPTEMAPKLKNFRTLARDCKNPKLLKELKGHSADYLSVKYGILPTVDDLKSIEQAARGVGPYMDKTGDTILTAGHSCAVDVGTRRFEQLQRIKLAVGKEDSMADSLFRNLSDLGIFPSYENLWDLVPYSFVVDWFFDVGKLLERFDASVRLESLNIDYVTTSLKRTMTFPIQDYYPTLVGNIDMVSYYRWVSDQCPLPDLTAIQKPRDFNHWLESGALIVQRVKH